MKRFLAFLCLSALALSLCSCAASTPTPKAYDNLLDTISFSCENPAESDPMLRQCSFGYKELAWGVSRQSLLDAEGLTAQQLRPYDFQPELGECRTQSLSFADTGDARVELVYLFDQENDALLCVTYDVFWDLTDDPQRIEANRAQCQALFDAILQRYGPPGNATADSWTADDDSGHSAYVGVWANFSDSRARIRASNSLSKLTGEREFFIQLQVHAL